MEGENTKKRGRPRKDSNSTDTRETEVTTTGRTENRDTERIDNEQIIQVDLVKVDLPTGEQTKKRGRPAGATTQKKKETKLASKDITPLLMTVFSLVSLKAGEHWSLSDEEADSISKPLVNILDKLDLTEKVSNMSDGAGLVLALIMIVAPRVMISATKKKETKKEIIERNGGTGDGKVRDFTRNDNGNTGNGNKGTTGTLQDDGSSIKAFTNSTVGFY
jgi:hypothetical protein